MKKKWLIILAVVVILAALAGVGAWKMGWFRRAEIETKQSIDSSSLIAEGKELYKAVASKEEAEEIANLYHIELVEFADGVAVYTTDEPVQDVVLRGKEEGYPEISINFLRKIPEEP